MTSRRTPDDLTRRRNLADASIADLPVYTGMLHRRVPARSPRSRVLVDSLDCTPEHRSSEPARIGTER
ncbi:hypothetical protein [Streptomyces sp. NPDC093109]|uniref:hypothetical protein n=1 Tax=Streptomyces sp. NPDC093109 TaxID=3154977 RepID=UPI00344B7A1E